MKNSLCPWLAPFVVSELRAVIEWSLQLNSVPKLKRDPERRFDDDGSNYLCKVPTEVLNGDTNLQLLAVVTVAPPVVLASDGQHSIQCQLSRDAMTTLEAELGEPLSLATAGDVFSLSDATLVTTPWGLSQGLVQFQINALNYQFHLRRAVGQPVPISQDELVVELLNESDRVRRMSSIVEDDASGSQEGPMDYSSAKSLRIETNVMTQPVRPHILTQPSVTATTQKRKRPSIPSIAKDGFEIEPGVNLAEPQAPVAPLRASETRPGRKAIPLSKDPAALLSLLTGSKSVETPREVRNESGSEHDATLQAGGLQPSSLPDQVQRASMKTKFVPYGRRSIPRAQQRLLDRKDSWYPSLPGYQFPSPNVPIEVLKQWNEQTVIAQAASSELPWSTAPPQPPTAHDLENERQTIPAAASPLSESEDEELGLSQWPPSPSQAQRDALPPDSTLGSRLSSQQARSLDADDRRSLTLPNSTPKILPSSARTQADSRSHSTLPLRSPNHPSPSRLPPPSSGLYTVIRGTQHSADDDEMEMAVPRPLVDPRVSHRNERSKRMQDAQRRTWLKNNCKVVDQSGPWIGPLLTAYQSIHSNDTGVTRKQFVDAIESVFPNVGHECGRVLALKAGSGEDTGQTSNYVSSLPFDEHQRPSKRSSSTTDQAAIEEGQYESVADRVIGTKNHHGNSASGTSQQQSMNGSKRDWPVHRPLSRDQHDQSTIHNPLPRTDSYIPSIFDEYRDAWRNNRPGGAFARPWNGRRDSRRHVEVASWKF